MKSREKFVYVGSFVFMALALTLDALQMRAIAHLLFLALGVGFLYAGIHFSVKLLLQINTSLEFNAATTTQAAKTNKATTPRDNPATTHERSAERDNAIMHRTIKAILAELVPMVVLGGTGVISTLLLIFGIDGFPCREYYCAAVFHGSEVVFLLLLSSRSFPVAFVSVAPDSPKRKSKATLIKSSTGGRTGLLSRSTSKTVRAGGTDFQRTSNMNEAISPNAPSPVPQDALHPPC